MRKPLLECFGGKTPEIALEHSFQFPLIPQVITILVWVYQKNGTQKPEYGWTQNYFLKSPVQFDAYRPSFPAGEPSVEAALGAAVEGMNRFFQMAIDAGYIPDESWLVPNEDFLD